MLSIFYNQTIRLFLDSSVTAAVIVLFALTRFFRLALLVFTHQRLSCIYTSDWIRSLSCWVVAQILLLVLTKVRVTPVTTFDVFHPFKQRRAGDVPWERCERRKTKVFKIVSVNQCLYDKCSLKSENTTSRISCSTYISFRIVLWRFALSNWAISTLAWVISASLKLDPSVEEKGKDYGRVSIRFLSTTSKTIVFDGKRTKQQQS